MVPSGAPTRSAEHSKKLSLASALVDQTCGAGAVQPGSLHSQDYPSFLQNLSVNFVNSVSTLPKKLEH